MRAKNVENLTEGIVVSKMDGLFEPRNYNNERYVSRVSVDRVSGNHISGKPHVLISISNRLTKGQSKDS